METLNEHFEEQRTAWELDFLLEVINAAMMFMHSKDQITFDEWSEIQKFVDEDCRYEDLKVIFRGIVNF